MNINNRICCLVLIALMSLVGCTSNSGSSLSSDNFDRLKAAKTRVSLGLTYLKNGNFSQAKFNLDKALEFAPRSADANFAMAYYYQNVDELEQAEEAYQFAMALEPRNANIANSYGAFLCQNGDYEKAKEYFLKAVNTSNYISSAETYENLALCSQSQGRPEDTIKYLRSAVNHQPGRGNSLYLLAQTLVDTKQWQEARDVLRRYEKVSQISPQSLSMAIKIEQGTSNYTVAQGYKDMMLRIFPKHPITQEMLKKSETPKVANEIKKNTKIITKLKVEDSATEGPKLEETSASVRTETAAADIKPEPEASNPKDSANGEAAIAQDNLSPLAEPEYHTVIKGENLYRISLLYNIKMQRLIDWNSLDSASAIYEGMKLSLVAPSAVE